ncbi:chalcone isomerase family protein [Solimicrobium silvestre]|uniref:Chalcone-flavanone isomerase n=1 Tax=Solimicrobium silvestre TaxID=2099400 RepID=A0A2S9H4P1_9BURK|nr:chalcone isomerase family protein [Solimicrobium silvestre]PRC94913.1 Chalcone-flavanone isomerase [Solimicrobium silvestre]
MKLPIKELLFCLAFALASTAQAIDIAGAKIDDTIQASNTKLKLNGAGIRYKVIFKVYVAALYLTETQNTVEGIISVPGPKQINLTMLRDVSSDTLGQAFMAGVQKNTEKAERAKLTTQFIQFGQLFSTVPELKKGDMIAMEWVPNVGTNMFINGRKVGETFPDMAFFNAILRIWLGENPVDSALKKQLLGGSSEHH